MIPGVRLIGPAAFLEKSKTLVLADLHLGAEAALVGQGVMLPRTQHEEIKKLLATLLEMCEPEHVVLAGDIKHEFGRIDDEEWRYVLDIISILAGRAKLTVIKGNHDVMIVPILKKRGLQPCKELLIGGFLMCHGDALPTEESLAKAHTIIIGHEHPSILLDDGVRKEKFKCFIKGSCEGKHLLVLPSTYPLVEGSDVLREPGLGPIMKQAEDFEAFVIEGSEVFPFGRLDRLDDILG